MGTDDWMTIASLIFTLLLSGFLVGACQFGMGRHISTLSPEDKFATMKYFYMAQVAYKAAINLTKCYILLLYLRIFDNVRWFRWCCWFLLGCVGCYCLSAVLVTIFQCTPIDKVFQKHDVSVPGHCVDNVQFWYANAGFSIATDIVILLLPMPLVYKLHAPWAQKVALMAVFALGIFVVITSCLRITTLDVLATTPDTTYDIANVMWTIIEPNVAVVCACLPILCPFIVKIFPVLRSKDCHSSAKYATPGYGPKTRNTHTGGGSHTAPDGDNWVEIGGGGGGESGKSDGVIRMSTIRHNDPDAGSEENILTGPSNRVSDTSDSGIKKTVEYSIQYSNKR